MQLDQLNQEKKIEIVATYETLSEDHWNAPNIEPNFVPKLVVDISEYIDLKIVVLKCYKSQNFDILDLDLSNLLKKELSLVNYMKLVLCMVKVLI